MLRLNQQTVRNWIVNGSLPAVRVGQRRVRIRASDVEKVIAEGSTASTDAGERPLSPDATDQPPASDDTDIARAKAWERFASALADSNGAVVGNIEELAGALRLLAQSASELAEALVSSQAPD